MNVISSSLRLALAVASVAILGLPSIASGNVIYDAQFNYDTGYSFEFTMEFASPQASYQISDLVGGTFGSPKFFQNSSQWTQFNPFTLDSFQWADTTNPGTIQFSSSLPAFSYPGGFVEYGLTNGSVVVGGLYPTVTSIFRSVSVTERQSNQVPEPPTIVLTGLGLLGLTLTRRRKKPI